jgi:DNA recombination protein RmuC
VNLVELILREPALLAVGLGFALVLSVAAAGVFALRSASRRTREESAALEARLMAAIERVRASSNESLHAELSRFRDSQSNSFAALVDIMSRTSDGQMQRADALGMALSERLLAQERSQEARLGGFSETMRTTLESVRAALAADIDRIRSGNERALGEIRDSVEQRLQKTISERLQVSFQSVQEQLAAVDRGLGEMRRVAQDVDALRRVLSNVKVRGTFGEVQLENILREILLAEQFRCNVATRPGSAERVEFAVVLPGSGERSVLLPIDAKFPLEDYARLCEARDKADKALETESVKKLQQRIELEAGKIADKYIEVPYTTNFAVLYLPVESLWAEVLAIPGLLETIQRKYRVTVAGPTVLAALLNSLQMGFRTLAIERRSAEVWQLLSAVKMEFERFAAAVETAEKRMQGVQNALGQVRTRTSVMQKRLSDVSEGSPCLSSGDVPPQMPDLMLEAKASAGNGEAEQSRQT